MLMLLEQTRMMLDGLQAAAYKWADNNGAFKTKKVSFRKIEKKVQSLDSQKAQAKVKQWGLIPSQLFGLDLSKTGLINKLGKKNGIRMHSQLMAAGCNKTFITKYWRLSVK